MTASASSNGDPAPRIRVRELVQRGRMILDVAAADLDYAEHALGPFHPTTWHFRQARDEALRSWDRLRADLGSTTLRTALDAPPATILTLGDPSTPRILLVIGGRTYHVERVAGTSLAPVLWRLGKLLSEPEDDGPYYAARLRDGSPRCDCAEWTFQIADIVAQGRCKHLAALEALGWLG